jgi:hypothetical protein
MVDEAGNPVNAPHGLLCAAVDLGSKNLANPTLDDRGRILI